MTNRGLPLVISTVVRQPRDDRRDKGHKREARVRPSVARSLGLIESGDRAVASMNLAAVAVALRRFRLEHATYPSALAELAPRYLKTIPLDPFTGRPPEYMRSGGGFELRASVPPPEDASPEVMARFRGMYEWQITR